MWFYTESPGPRIVNLDNVEYFEQRDGQIYFMLNSGEHTHAQYSDATKASAAYKRLSKLVEPYGS